MKQERSEQDKRIEGYIRTISIFRDLEQRYIDEIVGSSKEILYPKDATICKSGRIAKYVYVVLEGEVSECASDPFLFSMEIKLAKPGHHFGGMSVLLEEAYSSTAVTTMPTKMLQISGEVYRRILWENPDALKELIKWFRYVLQRSFQRNVSCNLFNNRGRLAYILLMFLRDSPDNVISISQEKLARDYCGISRQTLSAILKKWESDKIISLSRCSIAISDPDALTKIILNSSRLK